MPFRITLSCALLFFLSGCRETTQSEDWYRAHPDEAYKTLSRCLEEQESSWNCEFALKAAFGFTHDSMVPDDVKRRFQELLSRYNE